MEKDTYSSIPILSLSPVEEIWLKTIYDHFRNNKRLSYRQIRAELVGKLPENFKRTDIDSRLVHYGLEEISLLGIIAIEKDLSILKKIDRLIYAIRDLLLKDPLRDRVKINEISELTELPEAEAGLLFSQASTYGRFYSSASRQGDGAAYTDFGIGSDDESFNQYVDFKGIVPVLLKYLNEENRNTAQGILRAQFSFDNELSVAKKTFKSISIFKSTDIPLNQHLGFVLMPFVEEWSDRVYKKIIRANIESLGLQCLRADNKHGAIVMEDIWVAINQAAFIVADVTGRNPNVMYELGIAHALSKPTIIITQNLMDIPFDFRHLRHYLYKDTLDGVEQFEEKFKEAIRDIYTQSYSTTL